MNLSMGPNLLRNTNGVFTVKVHNQIVLEIGETDGELLLTMDLYDPTGAQIAKLNRNAWISNHEDRFVITTNPKAIVLTDTTLKDVIIEANLVEKDRIAIPRAKFCTPDGALSEVTLDWWRISNTMELKGADIDLCGGAVEMP